jgi:hypothetical protein
MSRQIHIRLLSCAIVLVGCTISCATLKQRSNSDSDAVRQFTERFYAWYVPAAARAERNMLLDAKEMRSAISPEHLRALREDFEAQAQDITGNIVGLDFDPFLASQDPCARYEVRKRFNALKGS